MISAFGVEHVEISKRDRTVALGAGATAAGTGALLAGRAQRDVKRVAPVLRLRGVLHAYSTGDAEKMARHIKGAVGDAKKFHALGYAKHGLAATAAGLGSTAILSVAARKKQA